MVNKVIGTNQKSLNFTGVRITRDPWSERRAKVTHKLQFVRRIEMSEIESVKKALELVGVKYRIFYGGPRPAEDHRSPRPTTTKRKNATYARLYIKVPSVDCLEVRKPNGDLFRERSELRVLNPSDAMLF